MPSISRASVRITRSTLRGVADALVGRPLVPSLHTGVTGGWPSSTASTFETARSAIAVRVSVVALARCGISITFSSASRSGWTSGSFS